ncbi:Nitroreductase family [Bifidobacterium avesanii]|nr:Nitroreductase family [Bifidobacterium avesanii]
MKKQLGNIKRSILTYIDKKKNQHILQQEIQWDNKDNINTMILLLAHSLEKGMGLPNPRPGFGLQKAKRLLDLLQEYHANSTTTDTYVFTEGVSILGKYLASTENDISALIPRYQQLSKSIKQLPAGFENITDMNMIYKNLDTQQISYFISSRHSIRHYLQQPVPKETLQRVVALAEHAPSACNRQPVYVHYTTTPKIVHKINQLIPGNKGFENEVPNWALITADRDAFGHIEQLQWFVNGGIFLSYFVEALHAYHIASCIFQIPVAHPNVPKLRQLANIPDNEVIIAAVGFGIPAKHNKVLATARKPVNEVLIEIPTNYIHDSGHVE